LQNNDDKDLILEHVYRNHIDQMKFKIIFTV